MNRNPVTSGLSLLAVSAAVAGAVAMPLPAFAQPVSDRTLSDVRTENVGSCTAVTVNFNIRVQMLSHFPQGSGRELHIRVKPLDVSRATALRESLRTPGSVPALESIEYEGDNPGGPVLTLTFNREMQFTVDAGPQTQSLIIRLSEPGSNGRCETQAPGGAPIAGIAVPAGLYAVNLRSSTNSAADLTEAQKSAISGKLVYETLFERDAQQWHRLRLGFFETREAAEAARARLLAQFADAWVIKVSADERAQGASSPIDTGSAAAAPAAPVQMAGSEADTADTAKAVEDAENAIRDGNPDRAIALLTTAVAKPENPNSPRARELLGITREKKGQTAHAQAEYEEYLRRYPSGEGADRVRQRLAALTQAPGAAPTPQLRQASGMNGPSTKWKWGARGSFSQFYFRDQGRTSSDTLSTSSTLGTEVDNSVNINQLLTSGDITVTGGNDRSQLQLRAAGSYTKNFGTSRSITSINNGTTRNTYTSRPGGGVEALTALYLDWSDSDLGTQLRVGRQTRNSSGVLGRFDGALAGWQFRPKLKLSAVAGYPVLSSRQTWVLKERPFKGVSLDIGTKQDALQTTFYYFDQHARGGFVDRRSLGFEARYLKHGFNAFTILDYDVKFKKLNLGLLSLSYNFPDTSNITLTADYRRSPLLTTTNALAGQMLTATAQPVLDLAGLKPFFTDAQIYQLALDRTLVSKTVTLAYSRPLTKKLQANFDVTMTDTGGTPASLASAGTDAVAALPAGGKEYYYGAQLIGSGLFWENDVFILSGRYADTQRARTWTADFNARVPITSKFRLSPRLRYGKRTDKLTVGDYRQFQPTLRLNWYPLRHGEIEVEFGGNFTKQNQTFAGALNTIRESGYVLSAGYRIDF